MMRHLNENETFYLMLSTCMGILKYAFLLARHTKGNQVTNRRQWIDVKFGVMDMM